MSIEERFPPNSLSSFFVYEHSFIHRDPIKYASIWQVWDYISETNK